ncbi:MAG: indolepyruvate ferredoxin oxidoreductase subunit alpha, partial [Lentisphaeria bacterium]|nr:indolepyruvate ferredoxin oxidoreductase subunit alpha [Lentisphaeria bacterium]
PALIISRAPCPLHLKKRTVVRRKINADKCKNCKACLKCGCPAIAVGADGRPYIEPVLCAGCELCESTCKFGAIE